MVKRSIAMILLCTNRRLGCRAGTTAFNLLSALHLGFLGAQSQKTSIVGSRLASGNNAPLLDCKTMTFTLQKEK